MNPLHKSLMALYSLAWRGAAPLLRRHKRLREGFEQRLVPEGWPFAEKAQPGALRLWVQAASGGEAWLAHALAPALTRAFGAHPALASRPLELLCTTCTRQGLEVLEKLASTDACRVIPRYFPLDRPNLARKALAQAAPEALVLLETELWPGLLGAAKERALPTLLLNGRMTDKSEKAYGLTRSFWRALAPQSILAVSEDDAARFKRLFGAASAVAVMPNIKFDRMAVPVAAEAPDALRRAVALPERALLALLASVREEEEDALLPVLSSLYGQGYQGLPVAPVVAPRHMHRVAAWQDRLKNAGLPFALRSAPPAPPGEGPPPVLLWDSFGELQTLYAAADAVFVGGSLAPLGGQNFLEPAAVGRVPVVGPHVENFHWVGRDFFDAGLARQVADAPALTEAFSHTLKAVAASFAEESGGIGKARAAAAEAVREGFLRWLAPRLGGSDMAAEAVADCLLALSPRSG